MCKIVCSLFLIFTTLLIAAEDTYVFEVKGEFAKEMKALVEKYSKQGKIEATVYKKDTSVIVALFSKSSYNLSGQKIYKNKCFSCHGFKGQNRPSTNVRKLNQMTADEIEIAIREYKNNDHFGGLNKTQMQRAVINLSNKEIKPIIIYLLNNSNTVKTTKNSINKEEIFKDTTTYLK